jgi:hypothetical protein
MTAMPAALSARGSSAPPAEAPPVASPVGAVRERRAATGAVDRRSRHAPDRRARPEASPVLGVEECPRAGVEGSCWHRAVG